jgi:cytochrome c551/c552
MTANGRRRCRAVAVVGAALLLLGASACTAVSGQDRGDLAAKGETAFREQGCYGCHLVGKFGTPIGPDLSRIGAKYDEPYLARWLRDPSAQRPAHMPKLALSAAEVESLAAFLAAQR